MQKAYQLTHHPIGSKREFWALTWPLMIGLLSSTFMLFADRLLLARWNPMALNAAVTSGMAYYLFLVIPMGIVEIAEVLVGRLHGEERSREIGSAVWQMVWLAIALLPVACLIAWAAPQVLFHGSGNESYETSYFRTLMIGCMATQCATISLSGFFIGIGNVKIVTFAAIMGNCLNVALDYWMIFGGGPMPELGVTGAAAATAISQFAQMIFLFILFLSSYNRKKYGSGSLQLNRSFLLEGLRIGGPSGAGRSIEVLAHFLFFRIILSVGPEQMVLVAIAQSIYILSSFVIDAQCKGASAIVANLLGAEQHGSLSKILRSGFTLHFGYFLLILGLVWSFPDQIFSLFSAQESTTIKMTPELMGTFKRALIGVSLFFLFDGFGWILIGFLTAAKDTRYVFWVSLVVNSVAYIPPTLWFVGMKKGGADVAWAIIVSVTILTFSLYLWRYLSGKWLQYNHSHPIV
jgi:multidrug resistance protein, MATE family